MKQFIIAGILFIAIVYQTKAQDVVFPKGNYMSFDEIVRKEPSQQNMLDVKRRSTFDIKMVGGNDYKLSSADKSVSYKVIRSEMWGYSNGDTLFINCIHYKTYFGYANVLSDGKYLVFRASLSQMIKIRKEQMQMAAMFGGIGGAIAGAELAMLRFVYVVDKSTNQIQTVTPTLMVDLLQSDPDLLVQYQNESNKEDEITTIKYLKLINSK